MRTFPVPHKIKVIPHYHQLIPKRFAIKAVKLDLPAPIVPAKTITAIELPTYFFPFYFLSSTN